MAGADAKETKGIGIAKLACRLSNLSHSYMYLSMQPAKNQVAHCRHTATAIVYNYFNDVASWIVVSAVNRIKWLIMSDASSRGTNITGMTLLHSYRVLHLCILQNSDML